MGKFLRVLVVFFLLFSAAALTLGIMLFLKREMLKGRTQKLEDTIIMLGTTLETDPAVIEVPPNHQARDISPCTAELIETPEYSQYWTSYSNELEIVAPATMDVGAKRSQLMTYYLRDPITGEIQRDPTYGTPITKGPTTMQEVLDDIIARAETQYNRLNETREQLRDLREEQIKTINELNQYKRELRQALHKIVLLEATIRELEEKIRQLESKIRNLENRIAELEAEVAELKRTVQEREETIAERDAEIETLKKEIEKLKGKEGPVERVWTSRIDSEQKGPVVAVDNEWNFLVFKVTDKFIEEITSILEKLNENEPKPNIQFIVRRSRGDGPGDFVTKIRFKQLRKDEKLCVADILTNWLQQPVQEGDVVWYD